MTSAAPPPRAFALGRHERGGPLPTIEAASPRAGLAAELAALHARTYAEYFDEIDARFEADRLAEAVAFLGRFAPPLDGLWTVRRDDRLVASVALDAGSDPSRGHGLLSELRWLAVDPELRGRGLGRRLVQTALDAARAGGAGGVTLTTHERLAPAVRLYRALGFERREVVDVVVGGVAYRDLRMDLRWDGARPGRAERRHGLGGMR